MMPPANGPFAGVRVVEFASIGPGPHCAMLLADLGADVIRIDRAGGNGWPNCVVDRGRATMTLDIRSEAGRETCLKACSCADVVIEGFRPGVMERLGLGPDALLARNPRLVYGRMTGWGQQGTLAPRAGHDINYIALTGALQAIGTPGGRCVPPLNLVGDFGGGSMFLAFGIAAALFEREKSGKGQVVDAAIVDGVSNLMTMFAGLLPNRRISLDRSRNLLAGSAPFYRTYRCADGREVAIGALEPQFWTKLLELLGLDAQEAGLSQAEKDWASTTERLEGVFAARTSHEWEQIFENADACFAPVLSLEEAMANEQLQSRETYVLHNGLRQVSPAPRFSRTHGAIRESRSGEEELARWVATTGEVER
jgi:alpha-methylacyl-CoA racemase